MLRDEFGRVAASKGSSLSPSLVLMVKLFQDGEHGGDTAFDGHSPRLSLYSVEIRHDIPVL